MSETIQDKAIVTVERQ